MPNGLQGWGHFAAKMVPFFAATDNSTRNRWRRSTWILRQTPRDAGLSQNLWDGKALSAWIEREYGISLGVRQCQRMFRRLDFRLRKPRPMIGKQPCVDFTT
jgi:transposase